MLSSLNWIYKSKIIPLLKWLLSLGPHPSARYCVIYTFNVSCSSYMSQKLKYLAIKMGLTRSKDAKSLRAASKSASSALRCLNAAVEALSEPGKY